MDDKIKVKPSNKECFKDIIQDMLKKNNGQFQFTLSIHRKQILDYTVVEYVTFRRGIGVARKRNLEDVIDPGE